MEFFAAASLFGYFIYKAYNLTPSEYSAPGDSPTTLPQNSGYDEVSNDNQSTLNTISNPFYQKVQKKEVGPFGIPRVIYEGPGGFSIPTFGSNYNKY